MERSASTVPANGGESTDALPDGESYSAGSAGVLEASQKLFTARGFAGTSLQDIADELGVTKAAIYYHFKTKEAILRAVLSPIFGGMRLLLDKLDDASGRPAVRRQRGIEAFVDYLINNRTLMLYLSGDAAAVDQPWVAEATGEFGDRLHVLLVGLDRDTLANSWSHAIVGALTAVVAQSRSVAEDDLRVELMAVCDALTVGYRKSRRLRSPEGVGQV